jgi:hypothetical protein
MFFGKINIYNSLVSSAVYLEPEILNILDMVSKNQKTLLHMG